MKKEYNEKMDLGLSELNENIQQVKNIYALNSLRRTLDLETKSAIVHFTDKIITAVENHGYCFCYIPNYIKRNYDLQLEEKFDIDDSFLVYIDLWTYKNNFHDDVVNVGGFYKDQDDWYQAEKDRLNLSIDEIDPDDIILSLGGWSLYMYGGDCRTGVGELQIHKFTISKSVNQSN